MDGGGGGHGGWHWASLEVDDVTGMMLVSEAGLNGAEERVMALTGTVGGISMRENALRVEEPQEEKVPDGRGHTVGSGQLMALQFCWRAGGHCPVGRPLEKTAHTACFLCWAVGSLSIVKHPSILGE